MITGELVDNSTGEVVDFDMVIKQVEAMPAEQKAQAWVQLVESGKLSHIQRTLKNGVIDHMKEKGATKLQIPQGEVTLKTATTADYDIDAIEKVLPDAVEVERKLDRRAINEAKKLGGDVKASIEAAARVTEPTYSLGFKQKPTAEIEGE